MMKSLARAAATFLVLVEVLIHQVAPAAPIAADLHQDSLARGLGLGDRGFQIGRGVALGIVGLDRIDGLGAMADSRRLPVNRRAATNPARALSASERISWGGSGGWHPTGRFLDDRAVRQRFEEHAAVGLGLHPRIEDHDDPPVALRADQPAEALPQFDHRLGQLVIPEGVAAGRADRFQAGFEQRLVGHAERAAW